MITQIMYSASQNHSPVRIMLRAKFMHTSKINYIQTKIIHTTKRHAHRLHPKLRSNQKICKCNHAQHDQIHAHSQNNVAGNKVEVLCDQHVRPPELRLPGYRENLFHPLGAMVSVTLPSTNEAAEKRSILKF